MEYKLTCICLDDELPALKLIETYCAKLPELKLLESFHQPEMALRFLKSQKVDLAIMDIQMPGVNGIEFFKRMDKDTMGIFISANPQFAIQAYEIDIVDFIQKPCSFPRFEKAIRKAGDFFRIKTTASNDYITIKHDYISKKIKIADISHVEGSGEYLKIVTGSKAYLQFKRLKDFEEEHAKDGFVRIHKSYLVLRSKIVSANYHSVKLSNGVTLPIGRVYREGLK